MLNFWEDDSLARGRVMLLILLSMFAACLITLGTCFLTLHRDCSIVYFNVSAEIECADDTLLGSLLIAIGVFSYLIFYAYHRLTEHSMQVV